MENKFKKELTNLGSHILNASKNEIYLSMRFLDIPLSALGYRLYLSTLTIGTDGENILYNPSYLMELYQSDPVLVNRTYLHILFHCLFRHIINGEGKDAEYWNLACDIAVESIIDQLDYKSIHLTVSDARNEIYDDLKKELKVLTADGIYRVLLRRNMSYEEIVSLQKEFWADDHSIWEDINKKSLENTETQTGKTKNKKQKDNKDGDSDKEEQSSKEAQDANKGNKEKEEDRENEQNKANDSNSENEQNGENGDNQVSNDSNKNNENGENENSENENNKNNDNIDKNENSESNEQNTENESNNHKDNSESIANTENQKNQNENENKKNNIDDTDEQVLKGMIAKKDSESKKDNNVKDNNKNDLKEDLQAKSGLNSTDQKDKQKENPTKNQKENQSKSQSHNAENPSHNDKIDKDSFNQQEDRQKLNELEKLWKDISERTQTNLETFSRNAGDEAEGLFKALKVENRSRYDYKNFLKKFAVQREEIQMDADTFDYVFYTYGLSTFGNMPLIEPLEYKEVTKVEEFVIVIDTSGSCSGDLVKQFLNESFHILSSQESFTRKINVYIIQCDDQIQEVAKITSKEELNRYQEHFEVKGLGGTDFRPAFQYVNHLIEQKEFHKLKGLLYFTDGYGIYPKKRPNYDVAFVFMGDDYEDVKVPSWAMKLVIEPGGLQNEY